MFYVYILHSSKLNRFYVGTTDNVAERVSQHNSNFYKNAFTSKGIPWVLATSIACESSKEAYELEAFIKRMKSSKFTQKLTKDEEMQNSILDKIRSEAHKK